MARLNEANTRLAKEIISRYPRPRSATIPLLHMAQEQDGFVTNEAMQHIGELAAHDSQWAAALMRAAAAGVPGPRPSTSTRCRNTLRLRSR